MRTAVNFASAASVTRRLKVTAAKPEPCTAVEYLRSGPLRGFDADFRIYRRHSRHVVPCVMPG